MLENVEKSKIAYLIGLIAGDGAFLDGQGKRQDRMAYTSVDLDIIKWVSENIEYFPTTNPKLNHNRDAGIAAKQPSYTKTFSTKHTEFFKKFGVVCKKIDRNVFNISKTDMRHFLRGLFDSDGCVSWGERKDRDRIAAKVGFTHPSMRLLEKVQSYLLDSLLISSSIKPKGVEKCFVLSFSKLGDIEKFMGWLYATESEVVLWRKYKVWKHLQSVLAEKRNIGECYPIEFIRTKEYQSLIGSKSKYIYVVDGREYPSLTLAAKANGIAPKLVNSRAVQGNLGYSKRPKTQEEIAEHDARLRREINKLYQSWREAN